MTDLLAGYLTADHLGTALAPLVVTAILATVKYRERIRPAKAGADA